jgi:hypothetical protein
VPIITPKNWRDFQHYKERNPPWIRLHKRLLDDYEFQSLPVASKALAPMLWLLASDSVNGSIDADPAKLAFRLRMSKQELLDALKPLIDNGFFAPDCDASDALADCLRDAPENTPEAEALQRQRTEAETLQKPAARKKSQANSVEFLIAQGVDSQHAQDWLKVRSTKRAPLTESAWKAVCDEAAKAGITPAQAVEICAQKSWQGFNASWNWQGSQTPQKQQSRIRGGLSKEERDREAMRLLGFHNDGDVIDA